MLYTHIQKCNSDCTGVSVGHANTHRYGENYFLYWASCFVSYVNEHQSDYHGIIWFMFFELLILCAVNPLLNGGFPYRRSIVWNCVVWLIHFALLVERWCMIKGFHIPGPVRGVSICSNPPHKRTETFMSSFMFVQTSCWTNSGDASESKTQIILLLCNLSFSNWWHYCPCVRWNNWSPVDSRCKGLLELNFGGPVCGDSTAGGFP